MLKNRIKQYFNREVEVVQNLNYDEITDAVQAIMDAYNREANIYVFGNGGSAATASHFVCDFNKGISENHKKKFNLICLSDNTPIVTAIANDYSYDEIYIYQLKGKLKKEDLVIAISGSGNSSNIIRAVEYAKEIGTKVVGLTGYSGGKLKQLADYWMHVNIDDMQITEDLHMCFDHMMYRVLSDTIEANN